MVCSQVPQDAAPLPARPRLGVWLTRTALFAESASVVVEPGLRAQLVAMETSETSPLEWRQLDVRGSTGRPDTNPAWSDRHAHTGCSRAYAVVTNV
eukprot:scaffold2264_cov43-Tisochrysis_lutea.AAC.3